MRSTRRASSSQKVPDTFLSQDPKVLVAIQWAMRHPGLPFRQGITGDPKKDPRPLLPGEFSLVEAVAGGDADGLVQPLLGCQFAEQLRSELFNLSLVSWHVD